MKPNTKKLRSLRAQVDAWNMRFPVGTEVSLEKDSGEVVITKTRSNAELLSGHSAVIWLEGISGCYLLDRVKAV